MVSTRRKNQATKGTTARGGEMLAEQPSANGPTPHKPDGVKIANPAMLEQRMVTIEDGMNDLNEMVKRQAEEIERMNREREAWQKQHQEFQTFLINLDLGQQAPKQQETQRDKQD
jgi:hypothetical protein